MPTCEPCGTFYNPNTLVDEGTCPECGLTVTFGAHGQVQELEQHHVPWHFWVGVVAAVVYLGWRFLQGIFLLF